MAWRDLVRPPFRLVRIPAPAAGVQANRQAFSSVDRLGAWVSAAPDADLLKIRPDAPATLLILERVAWADDIVRASAFSLVQEHFRILEGEVARHGGAVVKTIGDAVMAVFADAGDCVRAGLAMQEAIAAFNATSGRPPITVKLGAHLGPTIAVSLNERLDYFGTTVNVAARVQNEAHGGDLVLTDEMLADPGVERELAGRTLARDAFEVRLKGLERPYRLTRFWLQAPQGTGQLLERMVDALSVSAESPGAG